MTRVDTIVAVTEQVRQGFHAEHRDHHLRTGGNLARTHWQKTWITSNHDSLRTPLTNHSTNRGHHAQLIKISMGRPRGQLKEELSGGQGACAPDNPDPW
jgi:hypothetical protein